MGVLVIIVVYGQGQVAKEIFGDHYIFLLHPIHEVCWKKCDMNIMVFNVDGSALTNSEKTEFLRFVAKS